MILMHAWVFKCSTNATDTGSIFVFQLYTKALQILVLFIDFNIKLHLLTLEA